MHKLSGRAFIGWRHKVQLFYAYSPGVAWRSKRTITDSYLYKSVVLSTYFRSYLCVSRCEIMSIQSHLRVTFKCTSRHQSPQHETVNSSPDRDTLVFGRWRISNDCLLVPSRRLVKRLIVNRKTSTSV